MHLKHVFLQINADRCNLHVDAPIPFSGCSTLPLWHSGQSVEFPQDFSRCAAEQLGELIVYGYRLANNSAPQLSARDNVRFTVTDQATGSRTSSDTGYLVTPLATTGYCVLRAQNMSQRKSLTVSLRSRSGL